MKKSIITLCLGIACIQISAQKYKPELLKTAEVKALVELVEKDETLSLDWSSLSNTSHYADLTMLSVSSIKLEDGDMLIDFNLKKHQDSFYHHLVIGLNNQYNGVIVPRPWDVDGDIGVVKKTGENAQMRWKSASEHLLDLGQKDTVRIGIGLFGRLNVVCEDTLRFGFNKQWPHLAGAIVALGSYGLSRIYRGLKHDNYDQYVSFWEDGRIADDAEALFTRAEQFQSRERGFRHVGIAIISADIIWYLIRWLNYKKKKREWALFCPDRDKPVSIEPFTNPSFLGNGTQSGIGLRMTYKF